MSERNTGRSEISLIPNSEDRTKLSGMGNMRLVERINEGRYNFCLVAHELWRQNNMAKVYDLTNVLGRYHENDEFIDMVYGEPMWGVVAELLSRGEDKTICKSFIKETVEVVDKALSGAAINLELTPQATEKLDLQVERIFMQSETYKWARNARAN